MKPHENYSESKVIGVLQQFVPPGRVVAERAAALPDLGVRGTAAESGGWGRSQSGQQEFRAKTGSFEAE